MPYCPNCGTQINQEPFCPSCGAAQNNQPNQQAASPFQNAYNNAPPPASGVLNIVQLVWAIISLVACCGPLGIAAIILTVLAKDAPSAQEEAKKLKIAKTCNIIATVWGVISVIATVALYVFIILESTV